MKKISVIGTVGVPACYGGFESLAENLLNFTPSDVEYTVFCSSKRYKEKLDTYKNAKLIYLERNANGKDSILYDFESMKKSLDSDFMLILGVSGCMFLPFIKRIYKGKIITNIDGIEWKRSKWNFLVKQILHFSERQAIKYSDIVIADNKGIVDYVKSAYKKDALLIEYGGDQATRIFDDNLYEKYPYMKDSYAITVCRIEPENNIHTILEAFKDLKDDKYVIVGNWNDSSYGQELKAEYSTYKNIYMLNPIYDSHEINWIRSNAALYVHGHSAGGTNPSLVEAMNLELPILAFDCVYNRETTLNECLYWKTSEELIDSIKQHKNSFSEIAKKMKHIGNQEYTWKEIARKYNELWK